MQQTAEQRPQENDLSGFKREEKALEHFKEVLKDLLVMIRVSCKADTAYMYWVNRAREQFVLETTSTQFKDVVFQDRVPFSGFILEAWKDLKEPIYLEAGEDFDASHLTHHMNGFRGKGILLLPFINNEETVALTVIEISDLNKIDDDWQDAAQSYLSAVGNILRTYLELNEMFQDEKRWDAYNRALDTFSEQRSTLGLLERLLFEAQSLVSTGGACILARNVSGWQVVLTSSATNRIIPAGLKMSEVSQAGLCLKSGEPEFTLHFNGNPKRISQKEPVTDGASQITPLLINYRRHGVLVVWDENSLIFRESLKHMITNMCRTAGLQLKADKAISADDDDLLTTESGAYHIDVLEKALQLELKRRTEGFRPFDTWVIFVTPVDYQQLRTKLGSERAKDLLSTIARDLNPNHSGVSGLVTSYTESVFAVLIQSKDATRIDNWIEYFKAYAMERSRSGGEYIPNMKFHFGITKISDTHRDAFSVIQDAKRAMNYAITKNLEIVQ